MVLPLQGAGDMNVQKILDKLERVKQSEETLAVDNSFQGIFFSNVIDYFWLLQLELILFLL